MRTPTLRAVVSTPSSTVYQVMLRYVGTETHAERENYAFPSITIPCRDYAHAVAVAAAFNA